jgi:hypothetical protein
MREVTHGLLSGVPVAGRTGRSDLNFEVSHSGSRPRTRLRVDRRLLAWHTSPIPLHHAGTDTTTDGRIGAHELGPLLSEMPGQEQSGGP